MSKKSYAAQYKSSVLMCIDPRLRQASKRLEELVREKCEDESFALDFSDLFTIPGAAKEPARNEKRFELLMRDIKLVVGAHQTETLYIISHTNCAAYEFSSENAKNQILVLSHDLVELRKKIREKFGAQLRVITLIAILQGKNIVDLKRVDFVPKSEKEAVVSADAH